MKEPFLLTEIEKAPDGSRVRDFLGVEPGANVIRYHRSFPAYRETPLADLRNLAKETGVGRILVKDESHRFGLNAFKVLGASYAMGVYLGRLLGLSPDRITCDRLRTPGAREKLGRMTFVTATDGNHGRGLAWTARELGHKAVIYMPQGSVAERLENIRAEGAEASIADMNYDGAVRLARRMGEERGWIVVQDTAWEGYEEIPRLIMQGYATMACEAVRQMDGEIPTHVFLQAGVGSMAGAVAGYLSGHFGSDRPVVTVVEPNRAACIFKTAEARDGELHFVTGPMDTIMAGLACGEPNRIAWDVLRETADFALSCPDWVAAKGMRTLGNPVGCDPRVISGESGAVTAGLVAALMTRADLGWMREKLRLDAESKVLCFSTEGDTDRAHYRRIVRDGLHQSP
ncbi:MAG: diaminopropionate ammonia-lyase [Deltaproteobacteria bacterium]|nr:diaminopropionate ammonia-lyase [Deltaproteobacteria bacterium]